MHVESERGEGDRRLRDVRGIREYQIERGVACTPNLDVRPDLDGVAHRK